MDILILTASVLPTFLTPTYGFTFPLKVPLYISFNVVMKFFLVVLVVMDSSNFVWEILYLSFNS